LLLSLRDRLGPGEGKVRLVLASQSPRRSEILSMMGLEGRFEAIPSPLDETSLQLELQGGSRHGNDGGEADGSRAMIAANPKEYTRILAEEKARALAEELSSPSSPSSSASPTIVLGSDTIVELDGRILEKPRDESEGRHMLSELSGREHAVHTGVAIVVVLGGAMNGADTSGRQERRLESSFTDTAVVRFTKLTKADIDSYVETGEPMDKAGSYGIQGIGGQFVSGIEGDFFTVMGLPMHRVSVELARVVQKLLMDSSSSVN